LIVNSHDVNYVIITLYSQQVQNTNDKEKDRQGQNEKLNCCLLKRWCLTYFPWS